MTAEGSAPVGWTPPPRGESVVTTQRTRKRAAEESRTTLTEAERPTATPPETGVTGADSCAVTSDTTDPQLPPEVGVYQLARKVAPGLNTGKLTAHFTITGEFLTSLSRQLWADERQPEKAINLLKEDLHGITMEQVLAILTGSKKLTGNSDDENGVEFVDDNATVSENGFPLGLKDLIARFRAKEDRLEDEVQFFSKNTELVPSPKGLVEVPRRRTKVYHKSTGNRVGLKEDVDLEKIPHRECSPRIRQEHMLRPVSQLRREEQGLEPGTAAFNALEEPPPPPPPPPAEAEISTDCGWLAPDGRFYACGYGAHLDLAHRLNEHVETSNSELRLEKLGWAKIQSGQVFLDNYDRETCVTQTQRDRIFDWCTKTGRELPFWMKPEED